MVSVSNPGSIMSMRPSRSAVRCGASCIPRDSFFSISRGSNRYFKYESWLAELFRTSLSCSVAASYSVEKRCDGSQPVKRSAWAFDLPCATWNLFLSLKICHACTVLANNRCRVVDTNRVQLDCCCRVLVEDWRLVADLETSSGDMDGK